ncbi:IS110 family transposase [Mucilaginibacter paludis]|uniref:Transposase n=1 Tax=Mucilaginibacter paludis DSM 18603 TaxID=714943 RepID=H1Y0R3_9SPHI|nr:IS110 family transposase [Mucilaginibacter paludis]EHQ28803.1 transposase [Mucilaginibacter paludis DSM 18603]
METYNVVLGVDVSKKTLDISCAERLLHIKIDYQGKGFAQFTSWCKTNGIDLSKTLVIMESTGGYEHRFRQFCESVGLAYKVVSGLEIKNAVGIKRGKNDKDDSFRIGQYGEDRIKRIKPSNPLNYIYLKVKHLLAFRKRLIREAAGYQASVGERKHMYDPDKQDVIIDISTKKMSGNEAYIKQVETELIALLKADGSIWFNYQILLSIKGIGRVNAWMTIAYTENFTLFSDPRKYGVYAGVIPFGNRSGTSLKGKDRVSHIANKEIKSELNQAAKTAIQWDKEIKEYAERKLKNKNYVLVLNNVKFKLILRMFSLVKRGEMYVENYKRSA